jgi:hypothetical protein
MFLSYEPFGYDGFDLKAGKHRWKFKIIDSEWEAVVVIAPGNRLDLTGLIAAIIQEYSKRELPVAANLIRVFQFESTKYGSSIQQIIAWNKQSSSQYKQLEEEMERYLVLL